MHGAALIVFNRKLKISIALLKAKDEAPAYSQALCRVWRYKEKIQVLYVGGRPRTAREKTEELLRRLSFRTRGTGRQLSGWIG